jgi:hypothetical protein
MSELGLDRRSLTPCLDENGMDDENIGQESSKEIELSDISDIEDENWQECNNKVTDERRDGAKANGNSSKSKDLTFKKITSNTRGRNYRDNVRRKPDSGNFQSRQTHQQPYRRFETKRREMERYSVRNIVASREFSISRSRSRSPRVDSIGSRHRSRSFSPKRDNYRRKSISPVYGTSRYKSPPRKYTPPPSKHSRSPSVDRYRSYQYSKKSASPPQPERRSRSRHKIDKSGREYCS